MRRTRRKPRKRFLWTGNGNNIPTEMADYPGVLGVVLFSPAQLDHTDVLVERVIIDYWAWYGNPERTIGDGEFMSFYVHVLETDINENPILDQAWDPINNDIDAFEKKPMYWRRTVVPFGPGLAYGSGTMYSSNGSGNPIDFHVKRRLVGDQSLVWVLQREAVASSSNELYISYQARVLLSVGRR